ncbi:MAG: DUF47 family protein [Candidatus Micrarchaeota archaeon]|nr:DUF47 family protein [Candidatus Micrarchaeota archaeon]
MGMLDETKVADWLQKRKHEKTLSGLRKHLSLVSKGTVELGLIMEGKGSLARLRAYEEEADEVRRNNMIELAKSELYRENKRDLMHLAGEIDRILNCVYYSGKVFSMLKLDATAIKMARTIRGQCQQSVALIEQELEKFSDGDTYGVIKLSQEIEEVESQADEIYEQSLHYILKKKNAAEVVLLHELFRELEMATDCCEKVGDRIRIITVSGH